MQNLQPFIDSLQKFAQKRLDFRDPPKLFLKQDQENAKDVFGKTAYYNPNEKSITLFTTGRHPKDILRSFAHELVHHCQNLRGDLSPKKCGPMGIDYAQKNNHMREMEREAYEKGNLCFRDWEDGIKVAMQQENNQLKENKQMVKISKKELKGLIGKIFEARMEEEARVDRNPDSKGNQEIKKTQEKRNMKQVLDVKEEQTEELEENEDIEEGHCVSKAKRDDDLEEGAFDDSHYCIHHGGVEHNGSIAMAEAIQHVAPDANGFISHYDMKLVDGTILENVAAEDIQVTNASLAEAHGKRNDGHKSYKKKMEENEELEEGEKPDFPDVDGDGDTKEPISKAQQDKKKAEGDSKKEEKSEKDLSNVPPQLRDSVAKRMKEYKIQTPEQEQKLYESRFNKRNEEIFNKLKKLWTK